VPYRIQYSREAEDDLAYVRRFHGATAEVAVRRAVPRFLADEPGVDRGARKRLQPNPLGAHWRLQVGDYRVIYNIEDDETVEIVRVGRKRRELLYLRGRPFDLRVD